MRWIVIILLVISTNSWGQNLVPNYSFEENDTCPITNGGIWLTPPWQFVYHSIDYYHECGTNGYSIPINARGGQEARTGMGYIGYNLWIKLPNFESHFCGIELSNSLIAGKKYKVEFYISMADSCWYAVKNIGMYFSQSQPPSNINTLLSYEPQVKYTGTDFLNDKEGWTKIEGSFYADGEEQFITIGNFDGHDNTDTLFVSGGGEPPPGLPDYWKVAAYYIDDVSVELDTLTGVEENEIIKFSVYPNPVLDFVTIETAPIAIGKTNKQTLLELYDVTGRVVNSVSLNSNKTTVDLSFLSSGIYTAALLQNGAVVSRKQIVKTNESQ